jgi:inorganic triphosphatase YgiF
MGARSAIERELKLGVWAGFELPDLAADGLTAAAPAERRLEAVYYDTADLRLLRRGITARYRSGEAGADGWTVKLPGGAATLGLARKEVSVAASDAAMPPELVDLTRGWALGAPLEAVARLNTLRRSVALLDGDGNSLAVVEDDAVSVLRGERVAARFHELEVELSGDAPAELLETLARRLTDAGAQPVDQVPKLVRALGPAALLPWTFAPLEAGAQATAGEVARARFTSAAGRLVDHHAPVALDGAPESVRRMRSAARTLRRDLRTFRPLLDRDAVRHARAELSWLSVALGHMRRIDVMLDRARAVLAAEDVRAAARGDDLLAGLGDDRDAALARLLATLRSDRYAALLAEVAALAAAPPFDSAGAGRPAADVLPRLVRAPLRRLRAVSEPGGEEPLTDLRRAVAQLRAAVDAAAPYAGRDAQRSARELDTLADLLRDHHHALVTVAALRTFAAEAPAAAAWNAGLLAGLELRRAAGLRARLAGTWQPAMRKRRWTWLD